jgi:hypothetical protein
MTGMISHLIRTELESYLHDLVVWGGTVFFVLVVLLSFMASTVVQPKGAAGLSGLVLLSVGLSSMPLAAKLSQRNALEKRTRLFSQLPVSTREVSIASWCVLLLCLWIPTVACTIFLARVLNLPFATFALATLATYLAATTVVAVISVAMSIRHLPPPIPAWANRIYIAFAIAAFGIWFIGNLLVLPRAGSPAVSESFDLPGVIGYLTVSSVGLVVFDVWLRERMDDYLG